MRIQITFAALGLTFAVGGAGAQTLAPTAADCDSSSFLQVLPPIPAAAPLEARAVWFNRALVRWPGVAASGVFRLYHSPTAGILATAGAKVTGAAGSVALTPFTGKVNAADTARFKYVAAGATLEVPQAARTQVAALHRQQLVLVHETADGTVIAATRAQSAGALDDLYARAEQASDLGVTVKPRATGFALWAPTAQRVTLCTYDSATAPASGIHAMRLEQATGIWRASKPASLSGTYYKYVVDVVADNLGVVRNLVTDPYSVSLSTDSRRSYIADLSAPALKPAGWNAERAPAKVKASTDMVVYELHVRDFSINDPSVPAPLRGKYGAFGVAASNGMRHLTALARAGMTDVHLLPIFDIGSVPESGCAVPAPAGAPDSDSQQALVANTADTDCFNWGYDPYHFNAPEGSYASDAADGARRIVETREMVMNLHKAGLRVGMDVVYNHTFTGGQNEKSVLDRIVPGYYHRLNAVGAIERSTCCDNTATEHRMMGKLMIDSAVLWTREYHIDSFRFDLMGHQPRAAMEQLQRRVDAAAGRPVQLIGEGWNFGEVENGARFVQASQLSLNGSGIGTFSDRARDAVRGGGAADGGAALIQRQGFVNGLVYDPNAQAGARPAADLLAAADLIKVGLAGSVRDYPLTTHSGAVKLLKDIDYAGQPAGYASEPSEAVNYVENHDNQTLYDINVFKLPLATSGAERARVQMLAAAINTFSQGVAYFHAGIDTLRSKSLDRNSFNSGDWFNRIDWSYQDNYFGTGLPPAADNGKDYALIKPLLANAALKPTPGDIAYARDAFRDLLAIRASSTLLRLRSTDDIVKRLRFYKTEPTVIGARIDGAGYAGAGFAALTYFINVDKVERTVTAEDAKGRKVRLHPVHAAAGAADKRAASARFDAASGAFTIPARTAVVFVE